MTCCAAVFLRGRYQILFSLVFQRLHFKKFSGYPFENNGGVFCCFCRRDSIPAVTGSEDQTIASITGCFRIPLADYTGTEYLGEAVPAEEFYTCVC